MIVKSITYLSFRFLCINILHVLNLFGSVYSEDDVSVIEIKAFCRVKAREPSRPSGKTVMVEQRSQV